MRIRLLNGVVQKYKCPTMTKEEYERFCEKRKEQLEKSPLNKLLKPKMIYTERVFVDGKLMHWQMNEEQFNRWEKAKEKLRKEYDNSIS